MRTRKSARQVSQPAAIATPPASLPRQVSSPVPWAKWTAILLIPFILGVLLATLVPVRRVGDGFEYMMSAWSFRMRGSPAFDAPTLDSYARSLTSLRIPTNNVLTMDQFGIPRRDTPSLREPIHFWWYGLLAMPFTVLAEMFGQPWPTGFLWLHMALLAVLLATAHRVYSWYGYTAACAVVLLSPALWFVDKAHTEFLTICCVGLAALLLAEKRPFWACLALSVAAAQNAALSVPAAVVWLVGAVQWWRGRRGRYDLVAAGFSIALNALSPVYYLAYFGTISPITAEGHAALGNITLKRMASVLIDPNLGLLPNWPLGLVLLLGGAALAIYQWRRRTLGNWQKHWQILLFIPVFVLTVLPAHASQGNHNHGGTVYVIRFALWFIALWIPLIAWFTAKLDLRALLVTAAGCLTLGMLTAQWFAPIRPETSSEFSAAARWFYRNFPSLHTPVKQVWVERANHGPVSAPVRDAEPVKLPGVWGMSNPDCTKVLILVAQAAQVPAPQPRPVGCMEAVDGGALYKRLMPLAAGQTNDVFVTVDSATLASVRPTLPAGQAIDLRSPESEPYTWGRVDTEGRWLGEDGVNHAVIGFRMDGARRGTFQLTSAMWSPASAPYSTMVEVNGSETAQWQWPATGVLQTVTVPIEADSNGFVRIVLKSRNRSFGGLNPEGREFVFGQSMVWSAR